MKKEDVKNLILIHDVRPGASAAVWESVEVSLSRWYNVICVDLPGFGKYRAEWSHERKTLDFYAEFLTEFCQTAIEKAGATFVAAGDKTAGAAALLADRLYRDKNGKGLIDKLLVLDTEEAEDKVVKAAFSLPFVGRWAFRALKNSPYEARVGGLFAGGFYDLLKTAETQVGILHGKRREFCAKQFYMECLEFFE